MPPLLLSFTLKKKKSVNLEFFLLFLVIFILFENIPYSLHFYNLNSEILLNFFRLRNTLASKKIN